jgi:hypothetical protein
MGDNVEAEYLRLRDLVLTWRNNQRHVSRLEHLKPFPQWLLDRLTQISASQFLLTLTTPLRASQIRI